jgi:hypothetical protein
MEHIFTPIDSKEQPVVVARSEVQLAVKSESKDPLMQAALFKIIIKV